MVSSKALDELIFWKENVRVLNDSTFTSSLVMEKSIFCDASGAGFGGYVVGIQDSEVVGSWSETESVLSSVWRELEAVYRTVRSSVKSMEGQNVLVHTDNKNVCIILQVDSEKPYLQEVALMLIRCADKIVSIWCQSGCQGLKTLKQILSRCSDSDDWSVLNFVFLTLEARWGSHTFDRFACNYNTKCASFNSRHWCPGTSGIDAFAHIWVGENNWLVPPHRLISRCVRKVLNEECKCTIIVPQWRSAPFWPLFFPDGKKKATYFTDVLFFSNRCFDEARPRQKWYILW